MNESPENKNATDGDKFHAFLRKRDTIDKSMGELLDSNSQIVVALRRQVKNFQAIAAFYQEMRDKCMEVADELVELLLAASDLTADVIAAEFLDVEMFETGGDDEQSQESEV